jgi:hypothetical protein
MRNLIRRSPLLWLRSISIDERKCNPNQSAPSIVSTEKHDAVRFF